MFNNPYNFYPYINQMGGGFANFNNTLRAPIAASAVRGARGGFFRQLTNIKWGSILTNTQKTLNVINQAIPVYYQIKPIAQNLKSFGKIMSAFNEPDTKTNNNNNNQVNINSNNLNSNEVNIDQNNNLENNGLPTFFIN